MQASFGAPAHHPCARSEDGGSWEEKASTSSLRSRCSIKPCGNFAEVAPLRALLASIIMIGTKAGILHWG